MAASLLAGCGNESFACRWPPPEKRTRPALPLLFNSTMASIVFVHWLINGRREKKGGGGKCGRKWARHLSSFELEPGDLFKWLVCSAFIKIFLIIIFFFFCFIWIRFWTWTETVWPNWRKLSKPCTPVATVSCSFVFCLFFFGWRKWWHWAHSSYPADSHEGRAEISQEFDTPPHSGMLIISSGATRL